MEHVFAMNDYEKHEMLKRHKNTPRDKVNNNFIINNRDTDNRPTTIFN